MRIGFTIRFLSVYHSHFCQGRVRSGPNASGNRKKNRLGQCLFFFQPERLARPPRSGQAITENIGSKKINRNIFFFSYSPRTDPRRSRGNGPRRAAAVINARATHRYHGPHVLVDDRLKDGFVKVLRQPVRSPRVLAAVRIRAAGQEVQLDVRLVVRGVRVLRVDEAQSLDAAQDRQRPFALGGVVEHGLHALHPFSRQRHLRKRRARNVGEPVTRVAAVRAGAPRLYRSLPFYPVLD